MTKEEKVKDENRKLKAALRSKLNSMEELESLLLAIDSECRCLYETYKHTRELMQKLHAKRLEAAKLLHKCGVIDREYHL